MDEVRLATCCGLGVTGLPVNIEEIMRFTETVCRQPASFESILQDICRHCRIDLDLNQYVLAGSTIRSYLAYLKDIQRVDACFADGRMTWQTV